jgi:hypothetical protein
MGFDHCQRNTVDAWIANSGYSIERYVNEPTNGKGIIVDVNAKLSTPAGTAATRSLAQVNLTPFMATSGAGWIWFGFRPKLETAGGALADWALWVDYQRGTTGVGVLNLGHLFGTITAGNTSFIEIGINLANGVCEYWKDGVLANTNTIFASMVAQFKLGNFQLTLLLASANTPAVVSYRDIYVLDDIPGDGFTGRLGAREIYPVTVDAVTPNDWTASNGQTPLEILTAPTQTANPGLMNSVSTQPLEVSLKSSIPADKKIDAIQLSFAAQGGSTTSRIGAVVKNGVYQSTQRLPIVGNTLKYGNIAATLPRNPDGTPWTNENLDTSKLVLTPDL